MRPQLTVDTTDFIPPYEQIRAQLADLIVRGVLAPHERLPAVRQLAADLGVAAGTVARSYQELEHAGMIVTRRGAGTRVAPAAASDGDSRAKPTVADRDRILALHAESYVAQARRLGANTQSLLAAVQRAAVNGQVSSDGQPTTKGRGHSR